MDNKVTVATGCSCSVRNPRGGSSHFNKKKRE
jgi:hypothetical protein